MFVGCSFDSQVIGGVLRGTVQRYMWQHRVELIPAQGKGNLSDFYFEKCHATCLQLTRRLSRGRPPMTAPAGLELS